MKYYHPIYKGNGTAKPFSGPYRTINGMPVDVPIDTDIWAVAYDIDNNTNIASLRCKPTLGQIIREKPTSTKFQFVPYNAQHTKLVKSGRVGFHSRIYADTYDEAKEMYNELINERISELQHLIDMSKSDIIV